MAVGLGREAHGETNYRTKDDLSGFKGEGRRVTVERPPDGSWTRDEVANEGPSLFKCGGKYYLTGAAFYKGRDSSVAASSDNVYAPYRQGHEAVPSGGGGNYSSLRLQRRHSAIPTAAPTNDLAKRFNLRCEGDKHEHESHE